MKIIIAYLKDCNGASLKDIADYLQVSEMTARRDLYELREHNVIHYISGSLSLIPTVSEIMSKTHTTLSVKSWSIMKKKNGSERKRQLF